MNDHVGDLGKRTADRLLDLARLSVRFREPAIGVEPEGQEDDQPVLGLQETQLAGRPAGPLPDDVEDGLGIDVHLGA